MLRRNILPFRRNLLLIRKGGGGRRFTHTFATQPVTMFFTDTDPTWTAVLLNWPRAAAAAVAHKAQHSVPKLDARNYNCKHCQCLFWRKPVQSLRVLTSGSNSHFFNRLTSRTTSPSLAPCQLQRIILRSSPCTTQQTLPPADPIPVHINPHHALESFFVRMS